MSFTSRQFKAMRVMCEGLDATPLLTIYPKVRVRLRTTGEVIERHIDEVVSDYDQVLKERRAERARQKKEAAA